MQPTTDLCPSQSNQGANKDCTSCSQCFNATEVQSRHQDPKQQDSMHLYAAERKLYQFYYAEVMKRKIGRSDFI